MPHRALSGNLFWRNDWKLFGKANSPECSHDRSELLLATVLSVQKAQDMHLSSLCTLNELNQCFLAHIFP